MNPPIITGLKRVVASIPNNGISPKIIKRRMYRITLMIQNKGEDLKLSKPDFIQPHAAPTEFFLGELLRAREVVLNSFGSRTLDLGVLYGFWLFDKMMSSSGVYILL